MTLQKKLQIALIANGWRLKEGRSNKYITLEHPTRTNLVFLGKAGSLRVGVCYTKSIPSDRLKELMLNWYNTLNLRIAEDEQENK